MKKLLRFTSIVFLSFLALTILILTILSIKYSPRYVYRLAKYNVADVYDYTHFKNRDIKASTGAFTFPVSLDENYVESLFRDRV